MAEARGPELGPGHRVRLAAPGGGAPHPAPLKAASTRGSPCGAQRFSSCVLGAGTWTSAARAEPGFSWVSALLLKTRRGEGLFPGAVSLGSGARSRLGPPLLPGGTSMAVTSLTLGGRHTRAGGRVLTRPHLCPSHLS